MKRILVTGANGQLGTTLKQQSLGSEDRWVFCGRNEMDITDSHSITSFMEKQSFDFCINCAAYTHVEGAETEIDAAHALNVEGVKNLVAACNEKQVTLLHISTDYVFDGTKKTPYVETDPTAPLNQYGKSKLQGEHHIQQKAKSFYIIRTSWLYSKTLGANFYSAILNKAKNGEPLMVVNDHEFERVDTNSIVCLNLDPITLEVASSSKLVVEKRIARSAKAKISFKYI